MVSVKSSTNTMMMMLIGACAIVGVLCMQFGFSMTFDTSYGKFLGSITEFVESDPRIAHSEFRLARFAEDELLTSPYPYTGVGQMG